MGSRRQRFAIAAVSATLFSIAPALAQIAVAPTGAISLNEGLPFNQGAWITLAPPPPPTNPVPNSILLGLAPTSLLGTIASFSVAPLSVGVIAPPAAASGTRFDTIYGVNTAILVVTPAAYAQLSLAGLPETAGEAAVGVALDAIRPAAGTRPDPVTASLFDPLYALPASSIPAALQQLSPGIYADGLMAARDTWYQMADAVGEAMASRRDDPSATSIAAHGSVVWTNGLGQFAHVSGSNAPGYHQSVGGGIVGIDVPVSPTVIVGAAIGGASVQTATDNGATDSGSAVQFAVYGSLHDGLLFADAQADYLHVDQSVRRNLGPWGVAATGNVAVNGGGAQFHAGVQLHSGDWQIEPTLGLTAFALTSPDASEATGGTVAAHINSQSITSLQSFIGVRVGTTLALSAAAPMRVYALLGWSHEFADTSASTTASLALTGPFGVSSPSVGRNAARFGVGISAALSPSISIYASYAASLSGSETAQDLTGGLRVDW
jgi:outer membrane autotransporter protein